MHENNYFANLDIRNIIFAVIIFTIGIIIAKIVSYLLNKRLHSKVNHSQFRVLNRFLTTLIIGLFSLSALQVIGFKFGVLLGAAGIFTLAIGFASQLAVSNIISGLFLYYERPFKIGETIAINNVKGKVYSIGALAVSLLCSDNTLIRVPNETLIKHPITNFSFTQDTNFVIRLLINTDIEVNTLIAELATILTKHDELLFNKKSSVKIDNITETGILLVMTCWTAKANLNAIKNKIYTEVANLLIRKKVKLNLNHQAVTLINGGPAWQ
ncbi:MAG: mechanosensitive ion channel domain-containing protein [Pseudomonadota bacterium]